MDFNTILQILQEYLILPIILALSAAAGVVLTLWILDQLSFCRLRNSKKLLDDTVIVITGGSNGIGKELAELITRKNEQKVKLIILDIVEDTELTGKLKYEFIKCDLSSREQTEIVFKRILEIHGKVDILVNNAAIACLKFFEDLSYQQFEKAININLLSYIQLSQMFLQQKDIKNGEKQLIFMGSVASFQVGLKTTEYNASKFGLEGFVRALRTDVNYLQLKNIKISIIHPYQVNTDLFKGFRTLFQAILPSLSIKHVAERVYSTIISKQPVMFVPFHYEFILLILLVFPTYLRDKFTLLTLSSFIHQLKGKQSKQNEQTKSGLETK